MNAYSTELSSSDSMTIQMGNYTLIRYHSPRLGFDINYPSFLTRQDLPESAGLQEIFMMDHAELDFAPQFRADADGNGSRPSRCR